MSNAALATCLSPIDGYRQWAATYDRELNPMLSLERRVLEPLLPPIAGLDVVDLGCGSGRWLEALKGCGAHGLTGVDFSPEMLSLAHPKLKGAAKILLADCENVPLEPASSDLILCNFVLSYIQDAKSFLHRAGGFLRPEGSLFLTDIHPGTATALNWRRGVRVRDQLQEIRTWHRTIAELVSLCEAANLRLAVLQEPNFGQEEQLLFEENGKQEYFDAIRSFPAIYVLEVTSPRRHRVLVSKEQQPSGIGHVRGARFASGPNASLRGVIGIVDSRIDYFCSDEKWVARTTSTDSSLDLGGYLVFPGLINSHDHLEFALFPRLGKGGYNNFLEWADDIHHPADSPIAEQRRVPRTARLWWGGIRNLLAGVTTVCHHNPFESEVFTEDFVVRVLREYGWAHSLALEPEVASKKRETPKGKPFLIHLAEGIDAESAGEIFALDRASALDEDTVIIHGLGLGTKGGELLRAANAGLVWCPSSNLFVFGKTLSREEIRKCPKMALGSDSPLTAAGDMMDEVRCAAKSLPEPAEIYRFVTSQPAKLLHLRNGEGCFRAGGFADLIAIRDTALSPSETLVTVSYRDIELVLLGGRIQLVSPEIMPRLPVAARAGLQALSIEGVVRWIRAPLDWLFEQTTPYLGDEIYLGGKQVHLAS